VAGTRSEDTATEDDAGFDQTVPENNWFFNQGNGPEQNGASW